MIHSLKCHPQYFERLLDGSKTFEVRHNDRGFQQGDTLRIREYNPNAANPGHAAGSYTGRELVFTAGFVLSTSEVAPLGEYVVISLLPGDGA